MSKLDYSKWDRLELSDDDDIEVHPNIDKASFIRWKQSDIHRKREERNLQIAQWNQELTTNAGLLERIQALVKVFGAGMTSAAALQACAALVKDTVYFEKERKAVLFDPEHAEYLQPKSVDEVFSMLMSRLCEENKVPLEIDAVQQRIPAILEAEIPKLNKRQAELAESIAKEKQEKEKKITSENIFKEKFSKTAITPVEAPKAKKKTTKASKSSVEVLNPNFQEHQKPISESAVSDDDEDTLQDLEEGEEKLMISFSRLKTFEDAFKFIQLHPRIVTREFSDHLMARAFRAQYAGKDAEARQTTRWALALSYCLQMGTDGTGLFFKRMLKGGPEAVAVFEQDVSATYQRIHDRCIVLKEKEAARDKGEIDENNSNLTPEQAVAFKTFPAVFQKALMSGDMDNINKAFAEMDEATAKMVMDKCQETGLISVLSEEESKKYLNADGDQAPETTESSPKGGMVQ